MRRAVVRTGPACARAAVLALFGALMPSCGSTRAPDDVLATRLAPADLDATARLVAAWVADRLPVHATGNARAGLRVEADARTRTFAEPLATALLATGRVLLVGAREEALVRLQPSADDAGRGIEVRLESPPGNLVSRLLAAPGTQ